MKFLSNIPILYFLFIGLAAIIILILVFSLKTFIAHAGSRLIFKFIVKFLSKIENKNLKNFNFIGKNDKKNN